MEINRYAKSCEPLLFDLLIDEGDEWIDYHGPAGRGKYIKTPETSTTYIACDESLAVGYVRCREDDGFGVYIYDLLVRKSYRGKQIGKMLMERVCRDFPDQPVYVMSDIDPFYEKLKLNISAVVISSAELIDTLNNAPYWWDADGESKHNAIFVIPPTTADGVIKEVGQAKPEYEKIGSCGKVIFWSAPIKTFSRTRWLKIVGTPVYNEVTIRNANTVKKLAERCREAPARRQER